MSVIDRARPVRESLDQTALLPWLRDHLETPGELVVEQFPSGFSNLTYLLRLGDRELVLRRPPPGADVRGGHDMSREYRFLTSLHGAYPVPEPVAEEPTGDVLGAPFYVMERVRGTVLRSTTPPEDRPDTETMASIAEVFVRRFADLHHLEPREVGLGDVGHPEGYVGRQIAGWTRRYQRARTHEIASLERAFAWLGDHQPAESAVAVVHNDFKYDNFVLDPEEPARILAVLDWELATVADPLMDLGSSLGYWVEADDDPALQALALSPTWWPGNPSREELVERYAEVSGRDPQNAVFYFAYGLVKLAGIAQQIYKRWTLGHTRDPRFEGLAATVRACGDTAVRAIDRGRLSNLRG